MIGKLTGTITKTKSLRIIVEVHGVGYVVHITDALTKTIPIGTIQTFFIHTHIREDTFDLYGFADETDVTMFELLLTVSGIGPKTAIGIMERTTPAIERAVKNNDVGFFTSVPRLGKKNAQKIIIELKNKLGGLSDISLAGDSGETKQISEALFSMGFDKHEISAVLEDIHKEDIPIEQKIRKALKLLAKHK